jgi:hypothetical protein
MQRLIEEPRRSTLIFVGSEESTQSTHFNGLRRVREPVSRSKSGVQGKIADVFSGRSRHAESLNELQAFRVLLATGHPDAWQEQPFVLAYHYEGKKHRYTPDGGTSSIADMEFRVSGTGPDTSRALQRVVM